jgi:probable phosphoglycerate mutase
MDANATEKPRPTPRRRIYLMRHGEVDYFDPQGKPFHPDAVPLNAVGRLQALDAAHALTGVAIDRVVSSGLPRSVETATLALGSRSLTVENRPALREIEPGKLSLLKDLSPEEVEHAFLGALAAGIGRDTRFLGGETFGELEDRVWPAFQALLAEPSWRGLLVVAHGVVNRVIVSRILGAGLAGLGALEQDAGCLNVLDVDDGGRCLIRLVNHTPYNPLKVGMELSTLERLYQQYCQGRPR